ncbi:hypothetical protein [Geodermatophilus ruber]|uniref:Heavy-metal-associated domain-containing protein n=1 Tax=Geodermatophilus ruber TaxID=504800 RepID=A0A1I4AAN6_9ACTN|nr:hypothetical protein [Geodermatophilus ruber]SFK53373.1 hypothetical protein SAMN04488085_102143 [Geodermatophilus ruber]
MRLSSTPVKLGAYAGGLAVAFAAAFTVGSALDPVTDTAAAAPAGSAEHEETDAGGHDDGHGAADAATPPAGLAVSERGYTLAPAAGSLPAGSSVPFAFTVTGPDGAPVQEFTEEHEKELHLIVVRRDLAGFQHVHPARDAAGTWSVPLDLAQGGSYRVFADFTPAALGEGLTLGTDLSVAGDYAPEPLPAPAATAAVDGYEIRLAGTPVAGRESELTFTVSRNGREVTDLEAYLGAFGHLVSLRTGDLAYLHTHPAQEAHGDETGGPAVQFATTFPTNGSYRLFLDFAHGGRVHTAEFTVTVGAPAAPELPASDPAAHDAIPHED